MRILGIDHGQKRVGIALSDDEGRIAHPHSTIARRDADALILAVAELVREHEVEEIVVGLPLCLDGSEGASARRARRFAERVQSATAKNVVLWDERMTSVAAQRTLTEAGVRQKAQRGIVDRVAAALLLQSYLDAQSHARGSEQDESEEEWLASEHAAIDERSGRSRGR